MAFVLAVATKLLPVVLVPLLWRRISIRDAFVGAGLIVLLYLPYATGVDVLFGIQNVVQHIRFNGPVFRGLMAIASPDVAARVALAGGLLTAAWFRWNAGQMTTQLPDLTLRLAEETARLRLPAILIPALLAYGVEDFWHDAQARFADDWPRMTRQAAAMNGPRVEDYVAALVGDGVLRPQ